MIDLAFPAHGHTIFDPQLAIRVSQVGQLLAIEVCSLHAGEIYRFGPFQRASRNLAYCTVPFPG